MYRSSDVRVCLVEDSSGVYVGWVMVWIFLSDFKKTPLCLFIIISLNAFLTFVLFTFKNK